MSEIEALTLVMKLALDRVCILESCGMEVKQESDALEVVSDMIANIEFGD